MKANEAQELCSYIIDLHCMGVSWNQEHQYHETRYSTKIYYPFHKVSPSPKPTRYLFAELSPAHQIFTSCWHQCSGQKKNTTRWLGHLLSPWVLTHQNSASGATFADKSQGHMVPLSMTMKIYHSMGRAIKGPSLEFKNRLGSRLMGLDTVESALAISPVERMSNIYLTRVYQGPRGA